MTESRQEPLARCELQAAIGLNAPQSMREAGVVVFEQRGARPIDHYQRGFGAEWSVPADVDAANPSVRLLLLAPAGPLVVDVEVYVNGKPFRSIRERWIDAAVNGEDVSAVVAEQNSAASEASMEELIQTVARVDVVADEPVAAEDAAADEAESDSDPEDTEPSDAAAEETDVPKQVAAQRYEAPGPLVRLTDYARSLDGPIDRAEARWLLAEWVPGPALLELRNGYGWERAAVAPVVCLLDADRDGELSADEIANSRERLLECDRNEDETVELREINRKLGSDTTLVKGWIPPRLLARLDAETDWPALAWDFARVYPLTGDRDGEQFPDRSRLARQLEVAEDHTFTPQDLKKLREIPADVTYCVSFGESDSMPAGVSVTGLNAELGNADEILGASEDVITLDLNGAYVEFTAVPGKDESGQISCGAVVDGYPLLRHLDGDGNLRFSQRDLRNMPALLTQFDRDGDGKLATREMATPIRLAFAQGPAVHVMLENPVAAAHRERMTRKQAAPVWFTPMDANNDGDITRSEFFGTDEQFRLLDADGDGLLSVTEAIASEAEKATDSESTSENRAENKAAGEDSADSSEQPAEE